MDVSNFICLNCGQESEVGHLAEVDGETACPYCYSLEVEYEEGV